MLGRVKRGTHALLFRFLVCLGFPYRLQEHLAGGRFAARLVVEGVLVAPEVRDHLAKKVVGTLLDLLPFLLFFHLLQRKKDSYRLSEFTTAIMRSYLYLHLILMQQPFVPIGVQGSGHAAVREVKAAVRLEQCRILVLSRIQRVTRACTSWVEGLITDLPHAEHSIVALITRPHFRFNCSSLLHSLMDGGRLFGQILKMYIQIKNQIYSKNRGFGVLGFWGLGFRV